MDEYNLGTDIDRHWFLTGEGDLATVSYGDNISQAVYNRLTCPLDELKWCYEGYGSNTLNWLGEPNNEYTRATLIKEIRKRLMMDPRFSKIEVKILDWNPNEVGICIIGTLNGSHEEFEEYFIFGYDRTEGKGNNLKHDDWEDTYITTRSNGYYGVPGQDMLIHAHICCKSDNSLVPIGNVSVTLGERVIGSKEIQQSGMDESGTLTLRITVPKYLSYGIHQLTFFYGGIQGYNSCKCSVHFHVVTAIPTITQFTENHLYMDVYDKTVTTDMLIDDANGLPVDMGTLTYNIVKDTENKIGTRIFMAENPIYSSQNYMKIVNCKILDAYGRLMENGKITLYTVNGTGIQKINSSFDNITFLTEFNLINGMVYRLEDENGDLVDNIIYDEENFTLSSTTRQGKNIIKVKNE